MNFWSNSIAATENTRLWW